MIQMMELSETNFLKTMFNVFKETEMRLRILALAKNIKQNQTHRKCLLNKKRAQMENLGPKQKTVT